MNVRNLHLTVDFLGSSGVQLTNEQKAVLQSSLTIVQHNENFRDLFFWGKILGLNKDYYIIQGIPNGASAFEHKTLYSQDCMNWGLLIPTSPEVRNKANLITGRFTGDPSYEFEKILPLPQTETEEIPDNEEDDEGKSVDMNTETVRVKEEDRLSAVIANIDQDTDVVPRGAYILDSTGKVYKNRMFEGLSLFEASKLDYYFHFRKPLLVDHNTMIVRADIDRAIDFMDSLSDDIPRGCWSIQEERGGGLVTLRSLHWIGYTFYHVPGTTEYGSAYVGVGEKNVDLPFMM